MLMFISHNTCTHRRRGFIASLNDWYSWLWIMLVFRCYYVNVIVSLYFRYVFISQHIFAFLQSRDASRGNISFSRTCCLSSFRQSTSRDFSRSPWVSFDWMHILKTVNAIWDQIGLLLTSHKRSIGKTDD